MQRNGVNRMFERKVISTNEIQRKLIWAFYKIKDTKVGEGLKIANHKY